MCTLGVVYIDTELFKGIISIWLPYKMNLFIPFLTCMFVSLEVSGFQHFVHRIIRKHMKGNISIVSV